MSVLVVDGVKSHVYAVDGGTLALTVAVQEMFVLKQDHWPKCPICAGQGPDWDDSYRHVPSDADALDEDGIYL